MTVTVTRHAVGVSWVEQNAMARAAHGLLADGGVWLVDPFEDVEALAAVADLGAPAGVVQLLDRHNRECAPIASRLGVPLLRLPADGAEIPFEAVHVLSIPGWHEVALWWPDARALVIAEAVGTAPAFALGRRAGVHPMLRLLPPRTALARFAPELLLVGHGPVLESGGAAALQDALAHSRRDVPRLVLSLPKLIRGS